MLDRHDTSTLHPLQIIGQAPAIVHIKAQIPRVATSGLAVLVVGETGVGKELVAREIHRMGESSGERTGPFVIIDCANLPNVPGALERQLNLAQAESSGTVFLDGLDELSRPLQARLLRILEDPEVARGATRQGVRIIAAARRCASVLRDAGQLRADLYYRVCECLIEIPPLRARGADIRLLADHILATLQTGQQLSDSAYQALECCTWLGNVRELESVIRRAALLHADRSILDTECLFEIPPPEMASRPSGAELSPLLDCSWEQAKEQFARWYWTGVWQALAGDRRKIAEHTQVSDVWLRSRRKLYALQDAEPGVVAVDGARRMQGESTSQINV